MSELIDQAFARVQLLVPTDSRRGSHGATTARSWAASCGSCTRPAVVANSLGRWLLRWTVVRLPAGQGRSPAEPAVAISLF